MQILNGAVPFIKVLTANTTDASYDAKIATVTEPTNEGVINLVPGTSGLSPQNLLVIPFGAGADNATMSVRVIGWTNISTLWIPFVLAEYDATLSAAVGIAAQSVINTDRFADTLALVANQGTDAQGTTKVSPANDVPGHFTVSSKGCKKMELVFKVGTATNANALYRAY
jgi:hypothetical protein